MLFCYIVYHYFLRFYRGVAHVIVILSTISVKDFTVEWFMLLWLPILSTITVQYLTEEWFMLFLLYYLPLLFKA
jgi:hypothetical protein